MIAKYRFKVEKSVARNVNNWNEHFDKIKETHSEEQDSNENDNLLTPIWVLKGEGGGGGRGEFIFPAGFC